MTLYHGSNADIDRIDRTRGLRHKDIGKGFYLTNYREGLYTPEEAARLLQDRFLDQQYYFGTERALRFLHKTSVKSL
jgi:hypothetical protein